MAKDHNAEDFEHLNAGDGVQAYQTLVDWVKSVPNVIQEIEKNGTEEDLIRYKEQIKLVVEKLKEIKEGLPEID